MRSQEVAVYKEIQKNTEMAMRAIDIINDKIYDEDLSRQCPSFCRPRQSPIMRAMWRT